MKFQFAISLLAALTLLATGCNETGIGLGKGVTVGNETGGKTPSPPSKSDPGPTASISGSVVAGGSTSSSGSQASSNLKRSFFMSSLADSSPGDVCSNGTYSASYVGGGGAVIASGNIVGGQFLLNAIPLTREVIVTFVCSDSSMQRCLAKSGDAGLHCDAVADAVLSAFESTLQKSINDPAFSGKPLSKVATSIVEASETDSTAAETFKAGIDSCRASSDANTLECYGNVIRSSIFSGSFKLMQSMAQGWSVESLFTFIADVGGFAIGMDDILYSDFGSKMDLWLSTDFIAKSRSFVSDVVTDQLSGTGEKYVIKLECELSYSKYHAGGRFKYSPQMATVNGVAQPTCKNDDALARNGFDQNQRMAIYLSMDNQNRGATSLGTVACDTEKGWEKPGYFCVWQPQLRVVSKFKEDNRNDPDGTNMPNENDQGISMIEVFPELFTSMNALLTSTFNQQTGCATAAEDGPPTVVESEQCQTWFGDWVKSQRRNFAGLMGLYLYLKDSSQAESSLLSLDDVYKIFTGGRFLNAHLAASGPGISNQNLSNGNWIPSLLAPATGGYRIQDVFKWDFVFPSDGTAKDNMLRAAIDVPQAPYSDTFKMFENIPTSDSIRSWLFGSAHHEEWNPYGGKFFMSSAVGLSGKPVFCRMTDKTSGVAIEKALGANTRIECLNDTQLTNLGITNPVDENGNISVPSDFAYPYVLQERGWMGDSRGRIYALANRKSGFTVRVGGDEILVEQLHPGNPAGECDTSDRVGSVVTAKLKFGWGNDTHDEAVRAYCLDMSDFTISSRIRFYWGGNVDITEHDSFGNTWKWSAGQIGKIDTAGSNPTDVSPVCYNAPDGNFSFDSQTKLVSSGPSDSINVGATIEDDGRISSLGFGTSAAVIAPCSQSFEGKTKYYLVQMGRNSEGEAKATLRAYLIEASGTNARVQFRNWAPGINFWEDLFAYVDASTMEQSLNAGAPGSTNLVAPNSPPTYTQWVRLLNQRHNAKFDPYCDDVTGPEGVPNGKCDCYVKGTTTFKDPDTCTLEDDAAEPTLSQAPYWIGSEQTAAYIALFNRLGGKSGEDLHFVDDAGTIEFTGNYLSQNRIWLNSDDVFQCTFKARGETTYRKPRYIRGDGFWKNHDGCPNSSGDIIAFDWSNQNSTGGPVRLISPKPMRNAYDIAKPNTLIKAVNYATKTVGQGVTLARTEKRFTFDEALALIAVRNQIPPTELKVFDGDKEALGLYLYFQTLNNGEDKNLDPVSAVLKGLSRPEEF